MSDIRRRKTPTMSDGRPRPSDGRRAASESPSAEEPTLPPMRMDALLTAPGIEVYALTTDASLIEAINAAGDTRADIRVISSPEKLRVLVAGERCRVAFIDADLLGRDLGQLVADLKAIEPSLVLVIAAPRETAEDLVGLLSDRTIHRLLIKPAAHGITRLLLESAISRHMQWREEAAKHARDEPEPIRAPKRRPVTMTKSSWPTWILAIAFVSLLVGVVLVGGLNQLGLWGPDGSPLESPGAARPFPDAEDAGAMPEGGVVGRSISTGTDDAEEVVDAEIEAPPETPPLPVPTGSGERVAEPVPAAAPAQMAERAVEAASPSSAASAVVEPAAEVTNPSPPPQPPAAAVPAPLSPVDRALEVAWARLRQNQLLTPPGDSARDYVEQALTLDPVNVGALMLRTQLAVAVADSAREALAEEDLGAAEQLADEAFRLGAPAETLALLDMDMGAAREIAAERVQRERLALGIARLRAGRLVEPERDSAFFHLRQLRAENPNLNGLAAAWRNLGEELIGEADAALAVGDWRGAETALDTIEIVAGPSAAERLRQEIDAQRLQAEYLAVQAPAGELRLLSGSPATYPAEAQRRGVEGWVEIEFIVGTDGLPRDARVVAADPVGWFEQAALASVALYRYEPFARSGRVYERLMRVRVRFGLE